MKGILNKVVANNKKKLRFGGRAAEPIMVTNPIFEKITNADKKPLISAINTLKKLPQAKKTAFKGQLDTAFKNQNLNKMKEIRNKAVMENREISEKEKLPKPPNTPKPNKPSFRSLVQKNKEKRVMNSVKIASQKVAISQANGVERKKLAVKYAPRTQANVTKANGFGKLLVRKEAEKAAKSAKRFISETEKMRAKARENKKFNNSLAEKRRILREREAKSATKINNVNKNE